ncbi:SLC13 family permease [Clostridium magnum]|uniref:Arsenical pump membrane protein n=1 Tax=Clostridium magnum DSM 2767 TaxID=1121326 RepID=A0A162RFS2_9CLOT|nr:ArsB/NhaD family transporter [Clostridium magnum]KZL89839.1 arsenical pump membrane protein [Clostridium magnum DSM 2767]SHI70274.1 possible tyrosine transporter P-protein [Clostridium magnum DSM 2767]
MDNTLKLIVACSIFLLAYVFIIFEKLDRTLVAFIGAALMILARVISQEHAFGHIDYNTIGLLIGMMIIVMVVKRTGLFEYLAIKVVKIAKGDPIKLLVFLAIITGLLSAVLDNVTTILLIIPITFDIVKDLHISPIPFIMAEVFASNVGGTATLIGDPPNIMIGSSVGLTFTDFIKYDAPIIVPLLLLTTYIFSLLYKRKLTTTKEAKEKILKMDEKSAIKDKKLLIKSLVVLTATFTGFILHGVLHYESATIAIVGAVILLTISKLSPEKILHEVEWSTILFFTGLFILVGGLQEAGAIKLLAEWVLTVTQGNSLLTTMAVLWVSAIASAFVDNIPFVATMIPMIKDMGELSGMNLTPLWWALSLGACLGGNGTIIGASANVIAIGMAKERGHKITFKSYFKLAFPMTILTVAISTIYLYLIFFL